MEQSNKSADLFVELLSLGFDEQQIKQALSLTDDKEKAVELILSFQEDSKNIQNLPVRQSSPSNKSQVGPEATNNQSQQQNLNQQFYVDPKIIQSIQVDPNLLLNVNQNLQFANQTDENDDYEDEQIDYKMAFLVRQDLKLGVGKIASQVAHAAVDSYRKILDQISYSKEESTKAYYQSLIDSWEDSGFKKIVLKVENLKELQDLIEKADNLKVAYTVIHDAGKTQVEPNTLTVAAIGPGPEDVIDKITRHLKLL